MAVFGKKTYIETVIEELAKEDIEDLETLNAYLENIDTNFDNDFLKKVRNTCFSLKKGRNDIYDEHWDDSYNFLPNYDDWWTYGDDDDGGIGYSCNEQGVVYVSIKLDEGLVVNGLLVITPNRTALIEKTLGEEINIYDIVWTRNQRAYKIVNESLDINELKEVCFNVMAKEKMDKMSDDISNPPAAPLFLHYIKFNLGSSTGDLIEIFYTTTNKTPYARASAFTRANVANYGLPVVWNEKPAGTVSTGMIIWANSNAIQLTKTGVNMSTPSYYTYEVMYNFADKVTQIY